MAKNKMAPFLSGHGVETSSMHSALSSHSQLTLSSVRQYNQGISSVCVVIMALVAAMSVSIVFTTLASNAC